MMQHVSPWVFTASAGLSDSWMVDSGASVHICGDPSKLENAVVAKVPVRAFGGTIHYATLVGDVTFVFYSVDNVPVRFVLRGVLYVENAPRFILSESILRQAGCVLHLETRKSFFSVPRKVGAHVLALSTLSQLPVLIPEYSGFHGPAEKIFNKMHISAQLGAMADVVPMTEESQTRSEKSATKSESLKKVASNKVRAIGGEQEKSDTSSIEANYRPAYKFARVRIDEGQPPVRQEIGDELQVFDDIKVPKNYRRRTRPNGMSRAEAHNIYGHSSDRQLDLMPFYLNFTPGTNYYTDRLKCLPCILANMKDRKAVSRGMRSTHTGHRVHIDPTGKHVLYWGLGGEKTLMIIVDDHSRFVTTYPLQHKSDQPECFKRYCREFLQPKIVRADNETINILKPTLELLDIVTEPIVPGAAHQNALVERHIGLVQDIGRVQRATSGAPNHFYIASMQYAAIVLRVKPRAVLGNKNSYEVVNKRQANIPLQVFGCQVFVLNVKAIANRDNVVMRGRSGIFIGLGRSGRFDASCKAVEVFFPEENKIEMCDPKHCRFVPDSFPFQQMRMKTHLIDSYTWCYFHKETSPRLGAVIAYVAPFHIVLLENGERVHADKSEIQSWVDAFSTKDFAQPAPVPHAKPVQNISWQQRKAARSDSEGKTDSSQPVMGPAVKNTWISRAQQAPNEVPLAFDSLGNLDITNYPSSVKRNFPAGRDHEEHDILLLPKYFFGKQWPARYLVAIISAFQPPAVTDISPRDAHVDREQCVTQYKCIAPDNGQLARTNSVMLQRAATRITPKDLTELITEHTVLSTDLFTTTSESVCNLTEADIACELNAEQNVLNRATPIPFMPYAPMSEMSGLIDDHTDFLDNNPIVDCSTVEGYLQTLTKDQLMHIANDSSSSDPCNDAQADASPHAAEWAKARQEELDALFKRAVFNKGSSKSPRVAGNRKRVLGTRWVYKYKKHEKRFKARLVVLGYRQHAGDGTFNENKIIAPTAHQPTIRLLVAKAVQLGWTMNTWDARNAYMQGKFTNDEQIDLKLPANIGGGIKYQEAPQAIIRS